MGCQRGCKSAQYRREGQGYRRFESNIVGERGTTEGLLLGRGRRRGVVGDVHGWQEEDQGLGITMGRCTGRRRRAYDIIAVHSG